MCHISRYTIGNNSNHQNITQPNRWWGFCLQLRTMIIYNIYIMYVKWNGVKIGVLHKRHNLYEPAHRELFNMQFFIITYIIPQFCIGLGGFQWGMFVIEDKSQQGRTPEEAENKKLKKGKIQKILGIDYVSKQFPFPLNKYLMQRLRKIMQH